MTDKRKKIEELIDKTLTLMDPSGINAKKYGSLQIPVAPLEKQREFSDFVHQVDKSKFDKHDIFIRTKPI